MAGRRRLTLLTAGVFAAHLVALDWFAQGLEWGSVLRPAAEPMFTRLLHPQAPEPPPPPAVAAAAPQQAVPEGALAVTLPHPATPPQATPTVAEMVPAVDAGADVALAQAAAAYEDAASAAAAAAAASPTTGVAEPAIAPAASAATVAQDASQPAAEPVGGMPPAGEAAAPLAAGSEPTTETAWAGWPADTRLSYRLGGQFREGELYGDARVQWQRDGSSYQVRLEIDITPWVSMAMTSQGEVSPQGLLPRAYEEARRGKRRAAQFGERAILLDGGRAAPKPEGVQDTASQFVELTYRFATGRQKLEVGESVSFWMARPGGVDRWTYDVVERIWLQTPRMGAIEAFHLKPRPIANPRGNVTAEMWFAPSLQYLPVRIKVSMGEEAYVDLLVDKIEQ